MTRTLAVATLVTLLSLCGNANASIIGISCQDDGDGAVVCSSSWQQSATDAPIPTYDLIVKGVQKGTPGDILGCVTTDTELDPSLISYYSIDNETDFGWTGYHVGISMNKTFSLSNVGVDTPSDWTVASITQPTLVGSDYVGGITFTGGLPINPAGPGTPAGTLDFHYKMTFAGSVDYRQTMTPVPEPATLALLGVGGLGLLVWRRKR